MTLRTTGRTITTTTPTRPQNIIMSGTNPNIKAMAANITNEKDGRTAGGFKTAVYVGKDQRPVSIMEVVPLKTPGWKGGLCLTISLQSWKI